MSDGSMDYICYQVKEASKMTTDREISELLLDLAKLLHDEEWWKSSDYSKDTYLETLYNFKEKWFKGNREERLKEYIDTSLEESKKELYSLIGYKYKGA